MHKSDKLFLFIVDMELKYVIVSEPNDLQNKRKQEYNIRQNYVNITNDDNWY